VAGKAGIRRQCAGGERHKPVIAGRQGGGTAGGGQVVQGQAGRAGLSAVCQARQAGARGRQAGGRKAEEQEGGR